MLDFPRICGPRIWALVATFLLASNWCFAEWKDSSPHKVRFVEVDPGVKLEMLDWGGSGEPILLLAGHGNTAHVFDEFAPRLTGNFHVLALTRRGFGASSQPAGGYDLPTLVNDISRVVDALHLSRVHLVGHSMAGDEMTQFAATFPEKTGRLVYLDAAYDRLEAQRVEASFPDVRFTPEPAEKDLASPTAMRSYIARTDIMLPESEIRATRVFSSNGHYLRDVTPGWIVAAVGGTAVHPNYKPIQLRMLAIYAVYTDPVQLAPRYVSADPDSKAKIRTIFDIWHAAAQEQRNNFRQSAPQARVVEIEGASHYVFISNGDAVEREIRAFLSAP